MFCIIHRVKFPTCFRSLTNINKNCGVVRLDRFSISSDSSHAIVAATNTKIACDIHNRSIGMASSSKDSKSMSTASVAALHTNRLIGEKSPYLLQHANNPVNWYPWCEEAIERARAENKLIFLSVGYSTCHWCHVMEKESFENPVVAKIMNDHFINIKVDREERPDIDKLYMTFILIMNGSGGWPMSVWLTPDLAPITGGTYFPPTDKWGVPGFTTILQKIAKKWETDEKDLKKTGMGVIEAIRQHVSESKFDPLSTLDTVEEKFKQSVKIYQGNYDKVWGGSNGAPKFPEVSKLNLLAHSHIQDPKSDTLSLLLITLRKMANGGIHDHIFGGFARYSVDEVWHIPHFEKMLYDQGQLLTAFTNAFRLTQNDLYLNVADGIFNYITKDLYNPNGGFYSGEDADSYPTAESKDKIEGAFYAWTYEEIKKEITDIKDKYKNELDNFEIYCDHYDIQPKGNVRSRSDPHGHLTNKNIHFVNGSVEETAEKFDISVAEVKNIIQITNCRLHELRDLRPRPHLDNKILCAWNGLILSGISKLGSISGTEKRDEYVKVAAKLVSFIRQNLYDANSKKLYRSCYIQDDGIPKTSDSPIYGFLDDYAFLIKGLIDYYVASLDINILHWARELQDRQDELFWDKTNSGYFYSEENSPNVVIRLKEDHDGAEPAGNSITAQNLLLLSAYYEEPKYKDRALKLFQFFHHLSPFGYVMPELLSAMLMNEKGLTSLVVVGPDSDESKKLIDVCRSFYIPNLVIISLKIDQLDQTTRKSVDQYKMVKNLPTAYVCHNQVCHLPIIEADKLYEEFKHTYLFAEIPNKAN